MGRGIPFFAAAVATVIAAASWSSVRAAGEWSAGTSIDKMSGAKTLIIERRAPIPFKAGSRTVRPRLAIQCAPKRPVELFVDLDFPNARTSGGKARLKFDDKAPSTVTGNRSDDGTALFLPGAPNLIRSLAKAKEFRVEVTPVTGTPVIVEFLVGGLDAHANALKDCGVKI